MASETKGRIHYWGTETGGSEHGWYEHIYLLEYAQQENMYVWQECQSETMNVTVFLQSSYRNKCCYSSSRESLRLRRQARHRCASCCANLRRRNTVSDTQAWREKTPFRMYERKMKKKRVPRANSIIMLFCGHHTNYCIPVRLDKLFLSPNDVGHPTMCAARASTSRSCLRIADFS